METVAEPSAHREAGMDPTTAISSGASLHPSAHGLSSRAPADGAAGAARSEKKLEGEGGVEAGAGGTEGGAKEDDAPLRFLCHVCLGSPNKPVATVCGHIYCWGCLYKWLSLHRDDPNCPVCKAGIEVPEGDLSKARVVPLYVSEHGQDPRNEVPEDPCIPQRPAGERPQPQRQPFQGGFPPGGFGFAHQWGNVNVNAAAGVGLFPSSLFGLAFQPPGMAGTMRSPGAPGAPGAAPNAGQGQAQQEAGWALEHQEAAQQEFLSRILFLIGTFIALALIFFP